MAQGGIPEEFEVGEPVLVCRWRLAKRTLPAANRHMRALGSRIVNGAPLSKQLLGWAKQHIEWTLAEGTVEHPNGVLMLLVDAEGRAAMAAGDYEPLPDDTLAGLVARARESALEATELGVAPETLWAVRDGVLVCAAREGRALSGVSTLVEDLAAAYGLPVARDADLLDELAACAREAAFGDDAAASGAGEADGAPRSDAPGEARPAGQVAEDGQAVELGDASPVDQVAETEHADEALGADVFLASDEHGIVPAGGAAGPEARRFADAYARLLEKAGR